jgi:hypothetical protein
MWRSKSSSRTHGLKNASFARTDTALVGMEVATMSTVVHPSNSRTQQQRTGFKSGRPQTEPQGSHPILSTVLMAGLLAVVLDLLIAYATGTDWHDLAEPATWVLIGAVMVSAALRAAWRHSRN